MTQVVLGLLTDSIGHARSANGFWATPSCEIRSVQAPEISIDLEHSGVARGKLAHLERTAAGLWGVGEIDDDARPVVHVRLSADELVELEQPWYWSPTRRGSADLFGIEILSVALTTSPARVNPRPVKVVPGPLQRGRGWNGLGLSVFETGLLERAAQAKRQRRRDEPIVVCGDHSAQAHALELRRAAPLEIRSAAAVDVNRSRRELDVLIAPAEIPAVIRERGRTYSEVISHGAFAGCEAAPEKVKVNMQHERGRVVGRAVALDPWSEQGLTGTLKLAKTAAADEALGLIADDLLGVSAGFAVEPNGDEWRGDRRRVRRAMLHHVALVDEAAYGDARVLASRSLALR